jgi:hypothetical protein
MKTTSPKEFAFPRALGSAMKQITQENRKEKKSMANDRIIKPLLLTIILSLLLAQCGTTFKLPKADASSQDPGFIGVYRNFPSSHPDFSGGPTPPITQGLIYDDVPWRPDPNGPWDNWPVFQPDWYSTPSCLVRIDPEYKNVADEGVFGRGLRFTPKDFQSIPELTGGHYALFTVEWEAELYMNKTAYLNFTMNSNDDSEFFFDGVLRIDLGGAHPVLSTAGCWMTPTPLPAYSVHTITIYYAERRTAGDDKEGGGPAEFYFGAVSIPDKAFVYTNPSDLYHKKSFEDLLRHQAEGIQKFEDLLEKLNATSRTPELFESLENLTEEQEGLLNSFEDMIASETPQLIISPVTPVGYNMSRLLPAEFVVLLDSFENLLHRQYGIKERFVDMLNESQCVCPVPNFFTLLNSTEDLLTSDDDLLKSFENLTWNLFPPFTPSKTYTTDQQTYFLESYEHLLENQSQLLEKFEKLIPDDQVWFKESFEDLLRRQSERIESFEDLLKSFEDQFAKNDFNVALNAQVTLYGPPFFTLWPADPPNSWKPNTSGTPASIVDGVFLSESTEWDQGSVWWDCYDNNNPYSRYIIISLGGSYCINSFIVQADNDEAYKLSYWDGSSSSWIPVWTVPNVPGWGMRTRPRHYLTLPIITDKLRFEGTAPPPGDYWFSVSEIQAFGYPSSTPELLESFENLTEEQEGLLHSFEGMIKPPPSLSPLDFIFFVNSTEDLLHRQYDIKESFMDMLNETKPYLGADFSMFMSSTEDLLRSDAQLLESFETLVADVFNLPGLTPNERAYFIAYFLESYEQLLESQSRLISKFEKLSGDAQADVAITKVDVSPTNVLPRGLVSINVTAQDPGDFGETFNVTVYANSQVIGVQSVSLESGCSTSLTFAWDTTGFATGYYTVSASASVVPDEVNTANNNMLASKIVTILYLSHDVAVTEVTSCKTVVGQGFNADINVTVANLGDYAETFNVTLYANTTAVGTQTVNNLPNGTATVLTFTWNTTGFVMGNYKLSAYAWPVPSETNTANNILSDGTMIVSHVGDVTGDFIVDISDVAYVAGAFGSYPGRPHWDSNCDINNDGKVDVTDLAMTVAAFGWHR